MSLTAITRASSKLEIAAHIALVRRFSDEAARPLGTAVVIAADIVIEWVRAGRSADEIAHLIGCEPYWNAIEDRVVEWLR